MRAFVVKPRVRSSDPQQFPWLFLVVKHSHEMWCARNPIRRMPPGKVLRLMVAEDATAIWPTDDWASTNIADATHIAAPTVWFADLPTRDCQEGSVIKVTFYWKESQRWEGRNCSVVVSSPH